MIPRQENSFWALIGFFLAGLCFLLVVLLAGFIAPYNYMTQDRMHPYVPPTRIHFVDCDGKLHLRPFVYVTKASG